MKALLPYAALTAIVGLAIAAAAESASFAPITSLSFELPFALFVVSISLMLFKSDYSRPPGRTPAVAGAKPVLLPANEAFVGRPDSPATRPRTRWRARHHQVRRKLARV